MSADPVLGALLAARGNPALSSLRAYVPDPEVVRVRLDANEAPALLPTLTPEERGVWDRTLAEVEPARYPDVRARALRTALSTSLSVDPDALVLGCGSDEVIAIVLGALSRPVHGRPPAILLPTPTFVMYRATALAHGYTVTEVPLDGSWDLDREAMLAALERDRPAVVFLATPNNPTSGALSRDTVDAIVEAAARLDPPSLVVVDEAYLPYRVGEGDPWAGATGLDYLARHKHVAVMRTFSKIGLAGLRVGYLVADPQLSLELEKVRLPYDLPAHSQAGALVAMGPLSAAVDRHVASIVRGRGAVVRELSRMPGLRCDPARTHANFAWVGVQDAAGVASRLKSRGVLVRTFPAFPDRFRVSFGSSSENEAFLAAMRMGL